MGLRDRLFGKPTKAQFAIALDVGIPAADAIVPRTSGRGRVRAGVSTVTAGRFSMVSWSNAA